MIQVYGKEKELGKDGIDSLSTLIGQKVVVSGWVSAIRSSGKILFMRLRDGKSSVQAVCSPSDIGDDWEKVKKCPVESSVVVSGIVVASEKVPEGIEISVTRFDMMGSGADWPLGRKEHGPDYLMGLRHLWLRDAGQTAILRIRSTLMHECRNFLHDEGFFEFSSPVITPSACEGTTTLFPVDYFGSSAYLSQSGQLYSEAGIFALEKVYCFGPVFRAEKSKTRRHLTEFWCVEPEAAWMDAEENMRLQERFIRHIVLRTMERHERDLAMLGVDTGKIRCVEKPFDTILYDDAVKMVRKSGGEMEWGDDFGADEEKLVADMLDRPFFIYKYPVMCRAFYIEPDPTRPEVALSSDCLMPFGFGEIITGGQRASDLSFLESRIDEHGLSRENFEWYVDLRRWGSVPHSGFGMGIERMIRFICSLPHIRETIPFPRMISRFRP